MHKSKSTSLYRYVTAVLLSALLLFPILSLSAYALSPHSYNMSKDYKNSIFYENLASLTLSGNGAADLLAVAMSQLGYHEGNSASDFAGANASGSKNFVEYNRLYGKLDNNEGNGYSYGYAWCASFVNWCLRQANIDYGITSGEVSCTRWINEFLKPKGLFRDSPARGGYYKPKAGDLIFFKKAGSSLLSTHVGIVRYADGTYVHTVEGNTASGTVALDAYLLDDSYIIGYGVPSYKTGNAEICDYRNSGKIAGTYIVTADTLNVRAQASANSSRLTSLKKATLVEVEGFENGFAKITTKDGVRGYASRYYLELVTIPQKSYHTVLFLDDDGSTVLAELSVEEGALPIAPTVPDVIRNEIRFTHVGWSQELLPVKGNTTFVAVYAALDAPAEGGADGGADTSGTLPPQETDPTSEETGGQNGCNAVTSVSLLLLSVTLAVPIGIVIRKKEKTEY